jgi:hypothetical protein
MPIDGNTQLDQTDVINALTARVDALNRDLIVANAYVTQVERERDEARHVVEQLSAQLGIMPGAPEPMPDEEAPGASRQVRRATKRAGAKKAPAKRATSARNTRSKK